MRLESTQALTPSATSVHAWPAGHEQSRASSPPQVREQTIEGPLSMHSRPAHSSSASHGPPTAVPSGMQTEVEPSPCGVHVKLCGQPTPVPVQSMVHRFIPPTSVHSPFWHWLFERHGSPSLPREQEQTPHRPLSSGWHAVGLGQAPPPSM